MRREPDGSWDPQPVLLFSVPPVDRGFNNKERAHHGEPV
jgi:hypothetical protein